MKDKELEKWGIFADKTKLRPHRYWCNTINAHLNITKDESGEDILLEICSIPAKTAFEDGKKHRSKEILNLLIED